MNKEIITGGINFSENKYKLLEIKYKLLCYGIKKIRMMLNNSEKGEIRCEIDDILEKLNEEAL